MQTCPAGEVRGSKRKDFERSFLGGTRALWRGGSQNPKGKNLVAREGSALSPTGTVNSVFRPLPFLSASAESV
jgi:hypothetical protein